VKLFTDMKKQLFPEASVYRLCLLYRLLESIGKEGVRNVTSFRISELLGSSPDSIRKDVSFLGSVRSGKEGYDVSDLSECIGRAFGFPVTKPACVVGLEGIGAAFIQFPELVPPPFQLKAGFDSSINRVETLNTPIPLFPSYQIEEIIQREKTEIALLTAPPGEARKQLDRLIAGGIRGVINFSPVFLQTNEKVFIRNSAVLEDFRILSAHMELYN